MSDSSGFTSRLARMSSAQERKRSEEEEQEEMREGGRRWGQRDPVAF